MPCLQYASQFRMVRLAPLRSLANIGLAWQVAPM
jgi:hypothetical protein